MQDEALWRRIETASLLSVSDLKSRQRAPFLGKPPSDQALAEIILEMKRFLYLLAIAQEPLTPSLFVADALRTWLTKPDTPMTNLNGLKLTESRRPLGLLQTYQRTRALRAQEFTDDDPEHIWPSPLSLNLQLLGWGLLAVGIVLAVLAKLGAVTSLAAFALLIPGGFLWFTEGPWPPHLPIRHSFVARLAP
ncbi:hypothetical protein [Fuscibacter oryzae]|uniref:Uncharacterized protein n=1 Tax=Fuscibacter oryzae TaxID=2803939 RepID=A0A8J7STM1_9RHOB|nr:hypothetical protein [Fuscibacter oryzae]MBL4928700.1 hypothetical protein [Fuscibacter oryzae]